MQYLYPMYISEVPESTVWDLVNVNVGATTHMTKLVLPGMQKRKRGAIVNVSSSAELQPMPLMAIYAATKVKIINQLSNTFGGLLKLIQCCYQIGIL